MKRAAIFVEGETEMEFIVKLLKELANENRINIFQHKVSGGGRNQPIRSAMLIGQHRASEAIFEFLVFNSWGDSRVASDMRDQAQSLAASGFGVILGLKDLRGEHGGRTLTIADLPNVVRADRMVESMCSPIPTKLVTAVMEIETWFLAETSHYLCIDPSLDQRRVVAAYSMLGFNPFSDDLTLLPNPAECLSRLYSLAQKG
ncbi:MAG: hypothetical protein U0176_12460 [Bacteroidia bacterium]